MPYHFISSLKRSLIVTETDSEEIAFLLCKFCGAAAGWGWTDTGWAAAWSWSCYLLRWAGHTSFMCPAFYEGDKPPVIEIVHWSLLGCPLLWTLSYIPWSQLRL